MDQKTDMKSLTFEELKAALIDMGEKPFRASQIYQWMHQRKAGGFDEMTNISAELKTMWWKVCICGIITGSPCAFPRRWGAAWDVGSARPLWTVWSGI